MEKITKENGWYIFYDIDDNGRYVNASKRFGRITITISRHHNDWWATVGYCEPEYVYMAVSAGSYRRVAELAEDLFGLCKKMINKKGE